MGAIHDLNPIPTVALSVQIEAGQHLVIRFDRGGVSHTKAAVKRPASTLKTESALANISLGQSPTLTQNHPSGQAVLRGLSQIPHAVEKVPDVFSGRFFLESIGLGEYLPFARQVTTSRVRLDTLGMRPRQVRSDRRALSVPKIMKTTYGDFPHNLAWALWVCGRAVASLPTPQGVRRSLHPTAYMSVAQKEWRETLNKAVLLAAALPAIVGQVDKRPGFIHAGTEGLVLQ